MPGFSFFTMPYALDTLNIWLRNIYSGHIYERNSDLIKQAIEVHPAFFLQDVTNINLLILKFLYLSVREVHLGNLCDGSGCICHKMIKEPHSMGEHLIKLFFEIISLKYPDFALQDESDMYMRFIHLCDVMYVKGLGRPKTWDITFKSMYATVLPFFQVNILEEKEFYESFHAEEASHPYVRLCFNKIGGSFHTDCRNFDMRGVNLEGSRCYSVNYYNKTHQFIVPPRDSLLFDHANFKNTDLRFAHLGSTDFRLMESLEGTNLAGANTDGSNIFMLKAGDIDFIP